MIMIMTTTAIIIIIIIIVNIIFLVYTLRQCITASNNTCFGFVKSRM